MATARTVTRALRSTPATSTFKSLSTRTFATVPRQALQQQARRGYASATSRIPRNNNHSLLFGSLAASLITCGATLYALNSTHTAFADEQPATKEDYQAVYDAVAQRLIDEDDYDDGSYGPIIFRLGWHCSGTYDAATGTGGSNGATMRFKPEGTHSANAGLQNARNFLEPIKAQFPWISYSDLWTLSAVCALQEMGGPTVPWRAGRKDKDVAYCTPDGRLPDASKDQNHVRAIFGRMGFNDQEMVALSGGHALGRCHTDHSGFEGPWTFSPITMTNDYYKLLLDEQWHERDWKGPRQFQDDSSKSLMMLPTDMALVADKDFKAFVEKYAKDADLFFDDFSKALVKLYELGVPFEEGAERIEFKRTE